MRSENINLGRITYRYSGSGKGRTVLLVAGGVPPEKHWLRDISNSVSDIWALDSGTDTCAESGVLPSLVIGDMDSIGKTGKEWIRKNNITVEKYSSHKDYTDLQIAIQKASDISCGLNLIISACWGGRFDHLYSNLFSCVWAMKEGINSIVMADSFESVLFMRGPSIASIEFQAIPEVVSLLPLAEKCCGVSIEGTVWELEGVELELYRPYSISNRIRNDNISEKKIKVNISEGWLGVYSKM